MGDRIDRGVIMQIQSARVILDELTSIDQPTDVDSVAERTGYSAHQVKRILNSPQYRELVSDLIRDRLSSLMAKNLKHLAIMVDNPNSTPTFRLQFMDKARALSETLAKTTPTQEKDERAIKALQLLDSIRQRQQIAVTPNLNGTDAQGQRNEVAGRASQEEDQDEGRAGDP